LRTRCNRAATRSPAVAWFSLIAALMKMSSLSNGCFPKGHMFFYYRGFFPSTTYRRHQPLFASPAAQGPEGGCPDTDPCPVDSPVQRRIPTPHPHFSCP